MFRLRPIFRSDSPSAPSRSTSLVLRTDNLLAAISPPGSSAIDRGQMTPSGNGYPAPASTLLSGWSTSAGMAGPLPPESLVHFTWNRWSICLGIGGPLPSEYAVPEQLPADRGHLPRAHPLDVALRQRPDQCLLASLIPLQHRRVEPPVPDLGDPKLQRPHPRPKRPGLVAIAPRPSRSVPLVVACAHHTRPARPPPAPPAQLGPPPPAGPPVRPAALASTPPSFHLSPDGSRFPPRSS